MKKAIALLIGALACGVTLAGADDVRIMFSTPGPDTYADQTAVKKGERYALVWKASADDAVTFAADGTVSGGKTILVWDTTENGYCSQVLFTVSETWLANEGIKGGVWSVYLLDTRVYAADGTTTYAAKDAKGVPTVVNASSVAIANVSSVASASALGGIGGGTSSAIPAGVTQPVIKGITIANDFVYVTVENTSACLNYVLAEGATPNAQFSAGADATPQQGNGTITLVTPKTADAKFFKVTRK